jgi:16S rRNA (cytidine1402-2'-O)-methyltransferase
MNYAVNTVLYESPHRLEKLLEEIIEIDKTRELFLTKEISKKYQHYYRGTATEIAETLNTLTIRGEWVVVIRAKAIKEKGLSFSEVLTLDLAPKPKAKILATLSDKSIKEWYEILIKK